MDGEMARAAGEAEPGRRRSREASMRRGKVHAPGRPTPPSAQGFAIMLYAFASAGLPAQSSRPKIMNVIEFKLLGMTPKSLQLFGVML